MSSTTEHSAAPKTRPSTKPIAPDVRTLRVVETLQTLQNAKTLQNIQNFQKEPPRPILPDESETTWFTGQLAAWAGLKHPTPPASTAE